MIRFAFFVLALVLSGCHGNGATVEVPVGPDGTDVVSVGVNEYTGAMGSAMFVTVPNPAGGYDVHVLHGGGIATLAAWSGTTLGSAAILADGLRDSRADSISNSNVNVRTDVTAGIGY